MTIIVICCIAYVCCYTYIGYYNAHKYKTVLSFKESLDLIELPVVTFRQGEQKFNFILDTGCSQTLLDEKCLKRLKYNDTEIVFDSFGIEGNKVEAKVYTTTIYNNSNPYSFAFTTRDLSDAFNVIKSECGVTLHGMLGSDFFNKYGYNIDYETYKVYSKK